MDFESTKNLGGVGAILVVIGVLGTLGMPYAGLLSLIGFILVLISLKGMADYYKEDGIFNNALYGFITLIVGVIVFVAVAAVVILSALASAAIDWTNPSAIQEYFMSMDMSNIMTSVGSILLALVLLFIFLVVSAVLFRKSLNSLSEKSEVKLFGYAGLLWLIGAVLSIIGIGLIIIWIAWILIAVGFFSMKKVTAEAAPFPQAPSPSPSPA
ncbi:MAG: DUF996 domain-containing protein [Candidatus Bathyarchaeota archaeon]|nr:DUF996 domain-containing protein [Candidatus Bathyarchaeota archaeon]MCX8176907.1 DUF996 domain-containing protein [Candidatus Bathyarchaeota archaeon]MDW8193406.1 DUF996 domain-containing protein [Nitrososphaerota archaeon]